MLVSIDFQNKVVNIMITPRLFTLQCQNYPGSIFILKQHLLPEFYDGVCMCGVQVYMCICVVNVSYMQLASLAAVHSCVVDS